MTIFGVDYASQSPAPAKLKAAGVHFVCRYHSTPGNPKNLTRVEAAMLKAGGIAIVSVFEKTANRALSGRNAGAEDARSALSQAVACGMPHGSPIYFAVDFDANPAQQTAINAYLNGAISVLGKSCVGVYGSYYVCKRALDAGACNYAWQTYAWSGGQWDKRTHIHQYRNGMKLAGISVDFDEAMKPDYGQWRSASIPLPLPKPKPKPLPIPVPKKPWTGSIWRALPGPKRKPAWWWAAEQALAKRRGKT